MNYSISFLFVILPFISLRMNELKGYNLLFVRLDKEDLTPTPPMVKFLLGFVLLVIIPVKAQVQDTLEYARKTAYSNNFIEADKILTSYNQENQDVYGLWLQAQVAWWMGDSPRSLDLYKRAIVTAPDLKDLKFDYARTLFHAGRVKQAEPLLIEFLETEPNHPEARILLAYMDYWNGKTTRAKKTAGKILVNDPENELANKLLEEISIATAPYITIASSFASDDQPLDSKAYSISAGKYFSRFLSPVLKAGMIDFTLPDNAVQSYYFEGGNKFKFGISGPEITMLGGVFRPGRNRVHTEYTFNFLVSQRVYNNFAIEVKAARIPYQYTLASIEDPLMQNLYAVGLSLNDPENIIGRVAYERQVFPGDNSIHTGYVYLLKSIINNQVFRFDLGYSFNYSHSDENTFQAVETSFLQPGMSFAQISGVYDPYFSPNNQMVNAALASVKIVPVKAVEIKVRSGYGFYAKADNPVIFTSREPGNRLTTEKFYYEQSYTPVEMFGEVKTNVAKGLYLSANYQYSKLFFYEYGQLGFSLDYSFLSN